MAACTSWRVGGPADRCYRPADLDDLVVFMQSLPAEEPVYWIGLGSNLLVRDGGIRGSVVLPFSGLDTLSLVETGHVRVGAGVTCAKVARFCARAGLVGAEFLAGIPGTMGGALAMNAGAFGGETWSLVSQVQTITQAGELQTREPHDYEISYRSVTGPQQEWFVSADLTLQRGDGRLAEQQIRTLLEQRNSSQPTRQPSCGSVFKNPPDHYAAQLIESCGLKGRQIGHAQVSDKHANFIINLGQASARDIENLIHTVQAEVQQQTGIQLQPEVRIVGEKTGANG